MENWRDELTDQRKKIHGPPDQNYSVAVVQRQIFSRSNVGFVLVNKQSLGLGNYDSSRYYHRNILYENIKGNDTTVEINKYTRVYGLDFNLNTKDNRWQGDIYYHRSLNSYRQDKNYSFGAFIGYFTRNLNVLFGQQALGENFKAEVGFVPGLDVYPGLHQGLTQVQWRLYPKSKSIAIMGPDAGIEYIRTPQGMLTDRVIRLGYGFDLFNTSRFEFGFRNVFQKLPEDFDPLDAKGDSTLLTGQSFYWNEYGFEYQSDSRKLFNWELEAAYGGFYNGTLLRLEGEFSFRYQPYGSVSLRADYSHINLPSGYGKAGFLLVGPRVDLTFTDKLFLTTFAQYNDRNDNVNLNARFQWRFKPASDFFVVYTENYFPESLKSKNRALVLKLTYWLNL